MLVGLLTAAPYANLDRPNVSDTLYWKTAGTLFAIVIGSGIFAVRGPSRASLIEAVNTSLLCAGGLWLGLIVGNHVNQWISALRPTFRLLNRMSKIISAFAVGYFTIVVLFSTFFAAVWRLNGPESFMGLPKDPGFPMFVYFSLVTATTVGYGDIVPRSVLARRSQVLSP